MVLTEFTTKSLLIDSLNNLTKWDLMLAQRIAQTAACYL